MPDFFKKNTQIVAQHLLGQILTVTTPNGSTAGIITETEAYTQDDPACHAYGGRKTKRNAPMFLGGGHIYIYFIYGMYHCINIVTEAEGQGAAVLIRAIRPITGLDQIKKNRGPKVADKNLANGPGKLVIAMDIDPKWNGLSLDDPTCPIKLTTDLTRYKAIKNKIQCTPRIGIQNGQDLLWRYVIC